MSTEQSSDFTTVERDAVVGRTIDYVDKNNCGDVIKRRVFKVLVHGTVPPPPPHRCSGADVYAAERAWEKPTGDSKEVICLTRGAIVECIECHRRYARSETYGFPVWHPEGWITYKRRLKKEAKNETLRNDQGAPGMGL